MKVFCVTRDEYDMIEDFIRYYGGLFGYSNIVVIDNMSVHPVVLDVYDRFRPLGVTVVYESNYTGVGQGEAFTKHMRNYKDKCEWLIGLDTDEFMLPMEKGKDVLTVLREIPIDVTKCSINAYPTSVVDPQAPYYVRETIARPAQSITTFLETNDTMTSDSKSFCRASAFVRAGNGNHHVEVSHGSHMRAPIQYLHFHNTGMRRMFERARNVIDGYKYMDVNADISVQLDTILRGWSSSFGYHRVAQYRMILTRMVVVDMFEKVMKQVPTKEEVDARAKQYYDQSLRSAEIRQNFVVTEGPEFSISQEDKDRLVFRDPPLPEQIKHITCVKDALEKMYARQ